MRRWEENIKISHGAYPGLSWLRNWSVVSSYEHRNEHWYSMMDGKFLDQLNDS